MADDTEQSVVFNDLFGKQVLVRFDQPHMSADGGALLLKSCDEHLDLTRRLAACIHDERTVGKVTHTLTDLIRQRVFGLTCGYEDCNDAGRLGDDPVHKLLLDRDPVHGEALASQPTLSRFENAVTSKDLMRMGHALADTVIARHRRRLKSRVKRIAIELDPTDDPTHGAQQLAFFNGHYDSWCYLPVAGFIRFDDEPDQFLIAWLLRPGNAGAREGAIGLLRRIVVRLRAAFPKAKLLVRLDGGFAAPDMFDFLESERLDYVVAMAENSILRGHAEPLMDPMRTLSGITSRTEHAYGECHYQAGSWSRARRVVIKAEVVRLDNREPKDNARFVVTNLPGNPQRLYERIYCQRGQIENRLKELHHGLAIDRTSCTKFLANQFRGLLTAAAYVLFQELRLRSGRTSHKNAQVDTLRIRLIKLACRVDRSVRRIVFHLPANAIWRSDWMRVALSLGAAPS
ncbi:MAG: IS1380 family transposase [Pseudomonadota bacterium]